MKNIVILGSTGSIGTNALNVIEGLKDFKVLGISANSNIKLLLGQIKKFKPKYVSLFDEKASKEIKKHLPLNTKLLSPSLNGLLEMSSLKEADIILNSLSGAIGLSPLLASIRAGKRIAIANKEPFVMAGDILMEEAHKWGAEILPVDSEPSAIFQVLNNIKRNEINDKVKRIFLTASGGAFYKYKKDFSKIKTKEALFHPTWKMGQKITIDSATLMNKGLEAIEIKNLFSLEMKKIEIIIHPQSIIHSAVEFKDNSVLAQLSNPDMRLPIQYALTYPLRKTSPIKEINFFELSKLEFFKPDFKKFPCLKLALEADKKGGFYPTILNASNEEAVKAFIDEKIKFTDIPKIIEKILSLNSFSKNSKNKKIYLSEIVEMDSWAREKTKEIL